MSVNVAQTGRAIEADVQQGEKLSIRGGKVSQNVSSAITLTAKVSKVLRCVPRYHQDVEEFFRKEMLIATDIGVFLS